MGIDEVMDYFVVGVRMWLATTSGVNSLTVRGTENKSKFARINSITAVNLVS